MQDWERELIKVAAFGNIATPDFEAFCSQVERTGLSFADAEIVPVMRWNEQSNRFIAQPVATLEGLRYLCDLTGLVDGVSVHYVEPEDLQLGPNQLTRTLVARVHVWRSGVSQAFVGEATLDHYLPRMKSGYIPSLGWRFEPALRLGRVAEALALRRAFPSATRNLRILEEIEREAQDEVNGLVPRPEQFKKKRQTRKELAESYKQRQALGTLGATPIEKVTPDDAERDVEAEIEQVKINALEHLFLVYESLLATGRDYGYNGPPLEADLLPRQVAYRIQRLSAFVERAAERKFLDRIT